MDAMPLKPSGKILSLQALRALSAILVVLFHNSLEIFDNKKYWASNPFPNSFSFGHSGVEIFFVISGFIMYSIHINDESSVASAVKFLNNRFVRIFPAYWIVLTMVLVGDIIFFHSISDGSITGPVVVSSYALIAWSMHDYGLPSTVLVVAWTLYHEVLFYLIFSIYVFNRRVGLISMGVWFLAASIMLFTPKNLTFASFYLSYLHILFGFGLFSSYLYHRRVISNSWIIAVIGILIFVLAASSDKGHRDLDLSAFRSLAYGLGAAMVIFGSAAMERKGGIVIPSLLVFVGDASYSIYLVHQPALVFVTKIVASLHLNHQRFAILCYITFPLLALGAGACFHLGVERPLLRLMSCKKTKMAIYNGRTQT